MSALKALQGDPEGVAGVMKLMEALDSYVPLPQREVDKPFLMPIEDVFSISGRGTVVTGRVERGKVKVGEEVEIVGFKPTEKKVVTGVEMFRKLLDAGVAGDNIGVLLRGVEKDDVERGQVLAKPGRSSRTRSSRARSTSCRRKRAAVTRRSSTATGRSSTSGRPTSPARSTCRKASRW